MTLRAKVHDEVVSIKYQPGMSCYGQSINLQEKKPSLSTIIESKIKANRGSFLSQLVKGQRLTYHTESNAFAENYSREAVP